MNDAGMSPASLATRPVLVAACGNELAGDDAFGPLVAAALRRRGLSGMDVVTLGMRPGGLLDHLEGRPAVLLVDAALPGRVAPPGTLVHMDYFAAGRPELVHDRALSSHGLSLGHELALAGRLGMLPPRVWIVAATIARAGPGDPVSAAVRRLVPRAADVVERQAALWLRERKEHRHA